MLGFSHVSLFSWHEDEVKQLQPWVLCMLISHSLTDYFSSAMPYQPPSRWTWEWGHMSRFSVPLRGFLCFFTSPPFPRNTWKPTETNYKLIQIVFQTGERVRNSEVLHLVFFPYMGGPSVPVWISNRNFWIPVPSNRSWLLYLVTALKLEYFPPNFSFLHTTLHSSNYIWVALLEKYLPKTLLEFLLTLSLLYSTLVTL